MSINSLLSRLVRYRSAPLLCGIRSLTGFALSLRQQAGEATGFHCNPSCPRTLLTERPPCLTGWRQGLHRCCEVYKKVVKSHTLRQLLSGNLLQSGKELFCSHEIWHAFLQSSTAFLGHSTNTDVFRSGLLIIQIYL